MAENEAPVNTETNSNPPAPAAPAAPAKPAHQAGARGKRNVIEIPAEAFKKRVAQEARAQAAQQIKAQFGMTMEDAKALIARAQSAPAGNPASTDPAAITAEATAKLQREIEKLKREAAQHKQAAEVSERKRQKETQRLKDRQIENELRYAFKDAGCNDPDYALHLFQRQALTDAAIEPGAFIDGLKKSRTMLFAAAAPVEPVQVRANTAPPVSQNPGESRGAPVPAGSTTAPKTKTADDMSPAEFAAHRKAKYGDAGI